MPRFTRVIKNGLQTPVKVTCVAQNKTTANKIVGKFERELKKNEGILLYALEQLEGNLVCLGWATVQPVKTEVYEELTNFANEELKMSLKLYLEGKQLHFVLN